MQDRRLEVAPFPSGRLAFTGNGNLISAPSAGSSRQRLAVEAINDDGSEWNAKQCSSGSM
jgi:hypothetical protein